MGKKVKSSGSSPSQVNERERTLWFYRVGPASPLLGPFDAAAMVGWWRTGQLTAKTLVRRGRVGPGNAFCPVAQLFPESAPPPRRPGDRAAAAPPRPATPFGAAAVAALAARGAFGPPPPPTARSSGAPSSRRSTARGEGGGSGDGAPSER
jgi:hypothetical protein